MHRKPVSSASLPIAGPIDEDRGGTLGSTKVASSRPPGPTKSAVSCLLSSRPYTDPDAHRYASTGVGRTGRTHVQIDLQRHGRWWGDGRLAATGGAGRRHAWDEGSPSIELVVAAQGRSRRGGNLRSLQTSVTPVAAVASNDASRTSPARSPSSTHSRECPDTTHEIRADSEHKVQKRNLPPNSRSEGRQAREARQIREIQQDPPCPTSLGRDSGSHFSCTPEYPPDRRCSNRRSQDRQASRRSRNRRHRRTKSDASGPPVADTHSVVVGRQRLPEHARILIRVEDAPNRPRRSNRWDHCSAGSASHRSCNRSYGTRRQS